MSIPVRFHQRSDDQHQLHSRVAELDAVLGERRAEVARVKSGLDAFGIDLNLKSRFRK